MTYVLVLQAAIVAGLGLVFLSFISFLTGFLITWIRVMNKDRLRSNETMLKKYAIRFFKSLGIGVLVVVVMHGLVLIVMLIANITFM